MYFLLISPIIYNSAKNTLSRHENIAKSFSIFKICAIMAPIIGVIVVLCIVFISIKTKRLGQLISLISLSKSTQALPVNDNNNFISSEWYDLAASACTAVLLGLWLLYLSLRYYRLFLRMYRTITLPFHECVSAAILPSYKVVLCLCSFNSFNSIAFEIATSQTLIHDNNNIKVGIQIFFPRLT